MPSPREQPNPSPRPRRRKEPMPGPMPFILILLAFAFVVFLVYKSHSPPAADYNRVIKLAQEKQFARVILRGKTIVGEFEDGLADKQKEDLKKHIRNNSIKAIVPPAAEVSAR